LANDSIIIKKKKVVAHAAHHGGSWKVAYADFVTAMMAFFMVLWIMGLSDDNKASIQGYFNDPAGFMKNPPRSKVVVSIPGQLKSAPKPASQSRSEDHGDFAGSDASAKEDTEYVKNTVKQKMYTIKEKDHIIVTETTQGILIEFMEDVTSVFFETGSAVISPLGKKVIKGVVPIIKDTGRFLVLEGHTDKKPYAGSGYTNWELSTDRAGAFRKELSKFGIPDSSFKEVRGCADKKLKFPKKPFAPGNRRVALLLPWGKKATKPNSTKIQNEKTRQALGPDSDKK
jgi:chemotaxis protein MotB